MAAALIGGAIAAGASIYGANKAAKSAKDAARQQAAGIQKGIDESQGFYEEGQGYLAPYAESGAKYGSLLDDIIGVNGPEAQQAALAMYKSSPSSTLLDGAIAETVRTTGNQFSAGGGANSGARIRDLTERTAGLRLGDYNNWQNLSKGMYDTGAGASTAAAGLAGQRAGQVLGARTGQGTAQASGTIGAANATMAGMNAAGNYLAYGLGKSGANDYLSKWMKPSGFQTANGWSTNPSSWLPS
jgi:hypothetical protein